MTWRPPRAKLTDPFFPYTTIFRSLAAQPLVAGCKEGLPNAGSLRNVSIKYVYYQSDRWDFWMNSAQHMSPDQNHARAQIDASRGALALARALPPLLCRQGRSEEHTSELQSLMRISYAVFCLKKKISASQQ